MSTFFMSGVNYAFFADEAAKKGSGRKNEMKAGIESASTGAVEFN